LPLGGELGPLDAEVRAAAMHGGAALPARTREEVREAGADWIRHADVPDDPVTEEGGDSTLRVVEELIGYDEIQRRNVLLHAADGAHGDHRLDAQSLQPVDVRPIVDVGRRQAMAAAVAAQEDHGGDPQTPDPIGVRRLPEGSPHLDPPGIL